MRNLRIRLLVAVIVFGCVGCTPAIIGVSFALGGATVGVTYEILDDDPPRDAGADQKEESR